VAVNKTPEELISALEKFEKNPPQLAQATLELAVATKDNTQSVHHLNSAKNLTDNLATFLRAVKGTTLNDPVARADMAKHSDAAAKSLGLLLQQVQSGTQLTADIPNIEKQQLIVKCVDQLQLEIFGWQMSLQKQC